MAAFVARTMETAGVDLGDPGEQGFADVTRHPLEQRINQLAAHEVMQGTSEDTYSPQARATRAQVATFLVRAYKTTTGEALPAAEDGFADTDDGVHQDNIPKAVQAGWAQGLTADRYHPTGVVRRDQQASFLARLLSTLASDGLVTAPSNASEAAESPRQ